MNKKMFIFSIGTVFILLLSIFPNITSKIVKNGIEEKINSTISKKQIDSIKKVEMGILKYDKNKKVEINKIFLTKQEKERMIQDLDKIAESDIDILEKFEKELEKIKEYRLLENDTKLEEIIDISQFKNKSIQFDNVTNQNFRAHSAPIMIVGGGFGLGLGMKKDKVILNSFSHFFAGIGGLASVICVDLFDGIIYKLVSFLMPILLGYIAGFTGIIVFCVSPGIFYSNLLMIGLAPFTAWVVLPQEEENQDIVTKNINN